MKSLRGTILGASIVTVVAIAYAAYGFVLDPVMTPLRLTGAVLLATGLGVSWGRAIWNMRHR
jgi:hypothetical protein